MVSYGPGGAGDTSGPLSFKWSERKMMKTRSAPSVAVYMTPAPHSVEVHESLSRARAVMREHRIRHLPVMLKGKLVGVLSDRDANLVEGLADAPADAITVEDAMTPSLYTVPPQTPLDEVVGAMIERRIGSAVVVDGSAVLGVFTTTDALRALADALHARSERQ
jgi:acetoin utilization protein AcuB